MTEENGLVGIAKVEGGYVVIQPAQSYGTLDLKNLRIFPTFAELVDWLFNYFKEGTK